MTRTEIDPAKVLRQLFDGDEMPVGYYLEMMKVRRLRFRWMHALPPRVCRYLPKWCWKESSPYFENGKWFIDD